MIVTVLIALLAGWAAVAVVVVALCVSASRSDRELLEPDVQLGSRGSAAPPRRPALRLITGPR